MRLAVLSDIHGNVRALDAVLADIQSRGIDTIVNLGDCLYGPFDPRPVAGRLIEEGWPTVAGNEDRCLAEAADGQSASRTARFTVDRLTRTHLDWIASLPPTCEIDGFALAFHGTPTDETGYLLHQPIEDGSMRPTTNAEIGEQLEGTRQPLILCGHDHLARFARLDDGRTIVNPGSVGCPAYTNDVPVPHAVANNAPHARYAIVRCNGDRFHVESIAVPYDWDAAAEDAVRNGFPDWAHWIATGSARWHCT